MFSDDLVFFLGIISTCQQGCGGGEWKKIILGHPLTFTKPPRIHLLRIGQMAIQMKWKLSKMRWAVILRSLIQINHAINKIILNIKNIIMFEQYSYNKAWIFQEVCLTDRQNMTAYYLHIDMYTQGSVVAVLFVDLWYRVHKSNKEC